MTGLFIFVGGWLGLNAVVFAALLLRRDQPADTQARAQYRAAENHQSPLTTIEWLHQ